MSRKNPVNNICTSQNSPRRIPSKYEIACIVKDNKLNQVLDNQPGFFLFLFFSSTVELFVLVWGEQKLLDDHV